MTDRPKPSGAPRPADLLERAKAAAGTLSTRTLAWGGLALAALILLCVNLTSSLALRTWKADVTQDRLFTIADGTRSILRAIDEPIKARVYYSRKLGETAPSYARYFERIRTLLEQYRDISGGKLQLEFLDPEPFSDAEDQAVAAGLRGLRLNAEGETGYFGLVASNATDNQEVIPLFSPDRESFVEYDMTKLMHTLSSPKKPVVGLMTGLPVDGEPPQMMQQQQPGPPPSRPWLIVNQIREFFNVETVYEDTKKIPDNIDVLLIAQPTGMTPRSAYAVDQFVLRGGKVLVFVDPLVESAQMQMAKKGGEGRAELVKLLKAWGVAFDPSKVAADIRNARRVQFGRGGGPGGDGMVTEYVTWLGLDRKAIDQREVLANGIDILNMASVGTLTPVEGATTTLSPIVSTSTEAMLVDTSKSGMTANPVALIRDYRPGGKALTLAARVSGEAKSAFPNGDPVAAAAAADAAAKQAATKAAAAPAPGTPEANAKPDDKAADAAAAQAPATGDAAAKKDAAAPAAPPPPPAPGPDHAATGKINVVVVADADMLADQFWVEARQMYGQEVAVPHAHNGSFVIGALENLTGSDDLIQLRGRGVKERRFTLVEDLRRDAERKFREKEEALTKKLATAQEELHKLETTGGADGAVIISDSERASMEKLRGEILDTRRELRSVKLALRHDIDRLDGWLKFANIALVPLLIGFAALGWSLWSGRRSGTPS